MLVGAWIARTMAVHIRHSSLPRLEKPLSGEIPIHRSNTASHLLNSPAVRMDASAANTRLLPSAAALARRLHRVSRVVIRMALGRSSKIQSTHTLDGGVIADECAPSATGRAICLVRGTGYGALATMRVPCVATTRQR